MISTHFSLKFIPLGPLTPMLVHRALYIAELCHTFQLQYPKNGPTDMAKTNQNQLVMLTDEDST